MPTDAVSVIIYSVYLALDAFWYLSGSAYFLIGSDHVKKWEMNEVLLLVDCFNRVYGTTAAPSPVAEIKKTEATEKAVTVSLKQLSQGSTGAQVKTIQRIIYVRGINSKIDIDGDFGPITKAGVIDLQKKLFPNTSSEWDGVVGKNTWTAALTALN